jgi:hypothetical protein
MKNSEKSVHFKHFGFRMVAVILSALTLCGVATAQNPVIDWNAIAVTTALSGNHNSLLASVFPAAEQVSMRDGRPSTCEQK